jgi:hypothetical protein
VPTIFVSEDLNQSAFATFIQDFMVRITDGGKSDFPILFSLCRKILRFTRDGKDFANGLPDLL